MDGLDSTVCRLNCRMALYCPSAASPFARFPKCSAADACNKEPNLNTLCWAGARNARHVADHEALFSFALDTEDQAAIDEVLAQARRPRGDCYTWERGGVF